MEIIKNIKKWILQWVWIFIFFWLIWVWYVVFAVGTWDTLTADMWNNRNAPDYDSGRVAAHTNSRHFQTFTHNLWVIPSDVNIYVSPRSTWTPWSRITEFNSLSNTYTTPEATFVTTSEFILNIEEWDDFIKCDATGNVCPEWETSAYQSWYIRIKAWK